MTTAQPATSAARASDRRSLQRILGFEPRCRVADVHQVRLLLLRHLRDDRLVEARVGALPAALVPDAEQRLREEPVADAVHRELVVLAPRDEQYAGAHVRVRRAGDGLLNRVILVR